MLLTLVKLLSKTASLQATLTTHILNNFQDISQAKVKVAELRQRVVSIVQIIFLTSDNFICFLFVWTLVVNSRGSIA